MTMLTETTASRLIQSLPTPSPVAPEPDDDAWTAEQLDGIASAVRDSCGPATARRVREILSAAQSTPAEPVAPEPQNFTPCKCANVGQCDGSCAPYCGGGGPGLVAPAEPEIASVKNLRARVDPATGSIVGYTAAPTERPITSLGSYDWLKAEALIETDREMCERWEAEGIDHALQTFGHDMTADNATGVVVAVADAFRRLSEDRIPDWIKHAPGDNDYARGHTQGWNDYRAALLDLVYDFRLDAPATVGHMSFGKGVGIGLVIRAAQREAQMRQEPLMEAERIEKGREALKRFREDQKDGDDIQF